MKICSLILLTLLTLTACKKEAKTDPYVSAKIDQFNFYSSGKMISSSKGLAGTYSSANIEGLMANGATMKIWIKNYSGRLETLSLDSSDASITYLPPTPSVETSSAHGTLTITSVTPMLSGTFSFTCKDSTYVTGEFSVDPL